MSNIGKLFMTQFMNGPNSFIRNDVHSDEKTANDVMMKKLNCFRLIPD